LRRGTGKLLWDLALGLERPSEAVMNIGPIDEALEAYVEVRMEKGREKAGKRFMEYVYLRHGNDEIPDFLLKVGGLARCYIYCLKIAENNLKGKDLAWFAAMAAIALYGCMLMASEDTRVGGIFLFSGALVHAWYLVKIIARKWKSIGMRISFYKEIIQIVEKELCR
jgi:hypothetical protein